MRKPDILYTLGQLKKFLQVSERGVLIFYKICRREGGAAARLAFVLTQTAAERPLGTG